jgi:hypothetical protein
MFPSNLRYSGSSLGYQIVAPLGGGLVPFVAAAFVGLTHGATWPCFGPDHCDRIDYHLRCAGRQGDSTNCRRCIDR